MKILNKRDPHQALKSTILKQIRSAKATFLLVSLQWGKDDEAINLHVAPNSFSSYGFQTTDFLSLLGFQRSDCSFVDSRQCYFKWVNKKFDVENFSALFDRAFGAVVESQKNLEKCGFFFNQPEGWKYFFGKYSRSSRFSNEMVGDGHTSLKNKQLKESEDEIFQFKLSWLEAEDNKGWTIHYRAKHSPLSSELQNSLRFLGLEDFEQCPNYNFESCHWRSIAFNPGGGRFDNGAEAVHGWFDAHPQYFSLGVKALLTANTDIEGAGFSFLPFPSPEKRIEGDIEKGVIRPKTVVSKPESFDVVISFSRSERQYAEKLASILRDAGFSIFYDAFYEEYLWGKNMVDVFDRIYRKQSRYCVMFVSKGYKDGIWTNHERQSAQARALEEKGKEYILPIKVDDTELDGVPPTIGHIPISKGVEYIAELLLKKLMS